MSSDQTDNQSDQPTGVRWGKYRAVALTLLAGLTLYSVLYMGLNSRWFTDRAEQFLSDTLTGNFRIDRLVFEPDLIDVVIYGADIETQTGEHVIEAERVRGSLDLYGLFTGRLVFDESSVQKGDVRLHIPEGEDDPINIEEVFRPAGEETEDETDDSKPLEVVFTNVSIAETDFEMRAPDFDFRVQDIDVTGDYLSIAGGELIINVDKVTAPDGDFRFYSHLFEKPVDAPDWEFDVSNMRIENWKWRNQGYTVRDVDLFAEGVHLHGEGQMDFADPENVPPGEHFHYDGDVEVEIPYWTELGEYFFDDVLRVQAPRLDVSLNGDLNHVRGNYTADVHRLRVDNWMLEDIDLDGRVRDQWIQVNSGEATLFDGRVGISGAGFNFFTKHFWGNVGLDGLQFQQLLSVFELEEVPWLNGSVKGGLKLFGRLPQLEYESEPTDPLGLVQWATQTNLELGFTEKTTLSRTNSAVIPHRQLHVSPQTRLEISPSELRVPEGLLAAGPDTLRIGNLHWSLLTVVDHRLENQTDLRAHIANISPWFGEPYTEKRGAVDLQAHLEGAFQYPRGQISISKASDTLRIPGLKSPVQQMNVALRLNKGVLRFDTFDILTDIGALELEGTMDLTPPAVLKALGRQTVWYPWQSFEQPIDVEANAEGVDARFLGENYGAPGLAGQLATTFTARGSIQRPELEFTGQLEQLGFRDIALGDAHFAGNYRDGRLQVDAFRLSRGAMSANLRGYIETDGGFSFISQGRNLDLRNLGSLGLPEDAETSPKGQIQYKLHGFGTLESPYLGGHMSLKDGGYGERTFGDLMLVATTRNETLHLEGSIPPDIGVRFDWPLNSTEPARGSLSFEGLQLRTFFSDISDYARVQIDGDTEITFAKDFSDYKISGQLGRIEGLFHDLDVRNRSPLNFVYTPAEGLRIDNTAFEMANRVFSVGGSANFQTGQLKLTTDGKVHLSLLNGLKQQFPGYFPSAFLESEGWVEVDLTIQGDRERLIPQGEMKIHGIEVAVRNIREPVQIETGRVIFGDEQIRIPQDQPLEGRALGGVARVHGHLNRIGTRYQEMKLAIWSHNNTFRVADTANLTFDSRLDISAGNVTDLRSWDVGGRVNIVDGLVYRDFSLFEKQVTGRVIGAFRRTADRYESRLLDAVPALGGVELDVRVAASDSVYIRNQIDRLGFDLELQTDVQVTGRVAEPSFNGNVNVVDGQLEFQGEEFEVRTGRLRFDGNPRDPWLDIVAGSDIENRCRDDYAMDQQFRTNLDFAGTQREDERQEYHVTLHLQGKVSNLDIELNSTPYADRRDILSLLLTGCTVDQLDTASAGGPTLEIALAPLLGQLEREIQDAVKVSEFSIMPGVDRTRVRIGDELTRRLSWNFRLDAGVAAARGGQEATLEYKLTDRWAVELSERSQQFRQQRETAINRYLLDLQLKYRLPVD
jgi:hypothetical protein